MRAAEIAVWWVVLVLLYLATLNTMSIAELSVAGALAVPGAFAARAGRRAARGAWRPSPDALRWLVAWPWAVLRDCVAVLGLAARRRPPDGEFETLPLAGKSTPGRAAGHEALATTVLSATPGSMVVEAGERHDTLLVHGLPIARTRLNRLLER